ncbi:MAG: hypothetical protein HY858_15300 [Candidatus Solibacter usitatus]|nr:hypothetical protein [Candidatus Solibacter usitatus]
MGLSRRAFAAALTAAPYVRAAGALRAGAATANISPALGASLAGFMTDRAAAEVHDELLVRCAALESGSTRLLLATIDSCMVPRTVLDRARARIARENSVEPACILMSSTHSHSAPPAMHLFQSLPDDKYAGLLEQRLGDAARMAFRRLRPARVGAAAGREPALVFNRRYFMREGSIPADPFGRTTDKVQMNPPAQSANILRPAGPVDPEHALIAAVGEDGRPIWVYGNYALHYAGFNPPDHASADYFGAWARRLEREAGGECAALLSNGCSANVNGIDFTRAMPAGRDYTVIERTAAALAAESLRVLKAIRFSDAAALGGAMEEVELSTRRPSADELAEAVKLVGASPANNHRERRLIYARETVFVAKFPAAVRAPVQGLRIGDAGIGAFPGETFVELGLHVKKASGFRTTLAVSIANDACGYIPTAEAFEAGGYETWRAKTSYLETRAAEKLTSGVVRALARVG